MEEFIQVIKEEPLYLVLTIVGCLILLLALFSCVVSIVLAVKYIKYNRKQNSVGKTGQELARELLDNNGCENVKVKCVGSLLWGNSYSHILKKVRLRRLTWKKKSVTSLAMASQKSCLAILDKENDKEMKKRNALYPIVNLGPLAFIPLLVIGIIVDVIFFTGGFTCTMIALGLSIALYAASFVLSLVILKVEKKAQVKALEILEKDNLATKEEIEDCKTLFKLYNIEYVNDMIMALLELIYRILEIVIKLKGSSSSSKK